MCCTETHQHRAEPCARCTHPVKPSQACQVDDQRCTSSERDERAGQCNSGPGSSGRTALEQGIYHLGMEFGVCGGCWGCWEMARITSGAAACITQECTQCRVRRLSDLVSCRECASECSHLVCRQQAEWSVGLRGDQVVNLQCELSGLLRTRGFVPYAGSVKRSTAGTLTKEWS
jgi:hypothetical protein